MKTGGYLHIIDTQNSLFDIGMYALLLMFVSTLINGFYCAGMFVSCYAIHVCDLTSDSFHVHYVFLTFNNTEY